MQLAKAYSNRINFQLAMLRLHYKKAQLSLTNPRDAV